VEDPAHPLSRALSRFEDGLNVTVASQGKTVTGRHRARPGSPQWNAHITRRGSAAVARRYFPPDRRRLIGTRCHHPPRPVRCNSRAAAPGRRKPGPGRERRTEWCRHRCSRRLRTNARNRERGTSTPVPEAFVQPEFGQTSLSGSIRRRREKRPGNRIARVGKSRSRTAERAQNVDPTAPSATVREHRTGDWPDPEEMRASHQLLTALVPSGDRAVAQTGGARRACRVTPRRARSPRWTAPRPAARSAGRGPSTGAATAGCPRPAGCAARAASRATRGS
jgi:hypothetical protein